MTGTRRAILLLAGMAAAVLVACSGVALAQRAEQQPPGSDNAQGGQQTPKAEVIPDQYIVVLKDKEDPKTVANEHASEHSIGVRPRL
jgi:hypothetical protein